MSDDPNTSDARSARERLSLTDIEFVRVIEDLVEVLLNKGLITITDLPERAREKLAARRSLRSDLPDLALLVDADDLDDEA